MGDFNPRGTAPKKTIQSQAAAIFGVSVTTVNCRNMRPGNNARVPLLTVFC